jgi:hypothetical protein
MKSTILVLSSLLASTAIAQPHHQHNARHHHNKRAEEVVWVTDWVTEYTTVDTTTTVWVSEGYVAPTTSSSTSSSSSGIPAQFFEGGNRPASPSATSTSTPIHIAPIPASPYTPPTTTSIAVGVTPAPTPSSTLEVPAYVAPVYTPPAETSAAAAPAASSPSSSGSSGGTCSSGSPCQGDITYYEAGLGACGLTNDGTTDKVVALPHVLMGPLSNTNPYCGKTITIKCSSTGKTTTATVVDKCMGCNDHAIDLSNAAFLDLDELAIGRTNATWWFN